MYSFRKNKSYESYKDEIHNKIWKNTEIELYKQVNELTLKLDELQIKLSNGELSFGEAGKILYSIRKKSHCDHHHHEDEDDDDDLIFCLDLVEKLWECVNSDGLSCDEFSELLSNMLNKNKSEFNVLFQKMDADGDETLSWNEYVSFLSQQQSHLWDQQEMKNVSYFKESLSNIYNLESNVNHMFNKICIINGDLTNKCTLNGSKYALLTSDNSIEIRNAMTLNLESYIDMTLRPRKKKKVNDKKNLSLTNLMRNRAAQQDANKNKHITSCTNLCPIIDSKNNNNTRLAVSFMDRAINIYSPSFNAPKDMLPIYLQSPIDRKKYNNKIHYHLEYGFFALDIPQSMQLFDINKPHLLVGETYGSIALYNYLDHNCLIRVNKHGINNNITTTTTSSQSMDNNNKTRKGPCVVKQVKKVPRIGIVSCGMDNLIIITDSVKWNTVRTLEGHSRGVYSCAFSLNHRMLVSSGYDRKIIVWDPYVVKPLGLLKGHVSSVVDVIINDSTNQIITASVDKKIKIYDVRTWKCLQTIRDTSKHQPINQLSAIKYDPYQACLITAGSKIKKWYIQSQSQQQQQQNMNAASSTSSCLPSIVGICYSNIFKQIISVHVDETCILWNVETGENSFEFKMNNNNNSSNNTITTAAIDEIGKRLLTASQNGQIKMWNFNNGAIMHEFEPIDFEITQLIYLPRTLHCVVGCGYNSKFLRFPSHQAPPEANFVIENKLHKNDVRAMCISKEYLLTASSDGQIIEWHIDSNVKSQIFRCPSPFISVTTMEITQLKPNGSWFLFVGTEGGILHIFEKTYHFDFVTTIKSDEYCFKEAILSIAVNETGTRLMIADCDITMKLFDISNLYKKLKPINSCYILMKEWKPHKNGCNTNLLYIPGFNVFCSSSDNGELILWNQDGMFVGQFGQHNKWRLFTNNGSKTKLNDNINNKGNIQNEMKNDDDNELENNDKVKSSTNSKDKAIERKSKRRSYFDDHTIYRPKFIKSVVTESIARTLLEDRTTAKENVENNKADKTAFEQSLDRLMVSLMKPKKKKRTSRRQSQVTIEIPIKVSLR